jgi:hypothetical protein
MHAWTESDGLSVQGMYFNEGMGCTLGIMERDYWVHGCTFHA